MAQCDAEDGVEDGILPLRWGESDDDSLAEERRLFYVGMTRAQERLYFSYIDESPVSAAMLDAAAGLGSAGDPVRRLSLLRVCLGGVPLPAATVAHFSRLDDAQLMQAILARDEIVSTAIGFGIAIPHARIDSVKRLCMAVGLSPDGIDYPSIDDKPVRVVVMIAASSEDQNLYLRVLSKVMAFLKRERETLMKCTTPEEAYALLEAH